jgi:hypothetical protein
MPHLVAPNFSATLAKLRLGKLWKGTKHVLEHKLLNQKVGQEPNSQMITVTVQLGFLYRDMPFHFKKEHSNAIDA